MNVATVSEADIKTTIFKLLGTIAPEADFDEIAPDEDLREALDIDSFDFLNLLIGLNETYGVDIPEADYGRLVTLDDLVTYLMARLG